MYFEFRIKYRKKPNTKFQLQVFKCSIDHLKNLASTAKLDQLFLKFLQSTFFKATLKKAAFFQVAWKKVGATFFKISSTNFISQAALKKAAFFQVAWKKAGPTLTWKSSFNLNFKVKAKSPK